MQDHEHIGHSKSEGGPTPTGNQTEPVTTCPAHGTMRTGGVCSQCQPTSSADVRVPGQETAAQQVITQADGQAFAREDDWAAEALGRELKELDEPVLTPGAPHPDPALAAKGWHVCNHGIYTRHPDGQLQDEPEAC